MSVKGSKLETIQVIRGMAALFVLLYHASALIRYRFDYDLVPYFWWGYSGVDIFFVLSGFIIYYTSVTNPSLTSWEFFLRRCLRIYPVYWIACFTVLGIAFLSQILHLGGDSSIAESVGKAGVFSLINTFMLIPKSSEIILVAWTLSYEITFYLLFALIFFRNNRLFFTVMFAWAAVSLIAAFLLHSDYSGTRNPILAMLNPIMIEFLFGTFVAMSYLYFKRNINLLKSRPFFLSLLILAIGIYVLSVMTHTELQAIDSNNQYSRFMIYGIPAAFIIMMAALLQLNWPKFLTFLGDSSYSIYLFHYPVLGILVKLCLALHLNSTNLFGFCALVLTTILACRLIYLIAEKPILEYGKREIKKLKLELQAA